MQAFARATKPRPGPAVGRPAKAQKQLACTAASRCSPAALDASDASDGEEMCTVCSSASGSASMLLCDGYGCKTAMHLGCARPPLRAVPRGDWFCPACDPYTDVGPSARQAWMLSPTAAKQAPALPGAEGDSRSCRPATASAAAATMQAAARTAEQTERAQLIRRLRAAARDLHYSSTPQSLLCRSAEFERICAFVRQAADSASGGGLYVSGTPGNGKTVTINLVREELSRDMAAGVRPRMPLIFLNAFAFVESPPDLYSAIEAALEASEAAVHTHTRLHTKQAKAAQPAGERGSPLAPSQRGKAHAHAALARLERRFAAPLFAPVPPAAPRAASPRAGAGTRGGQVARSAVARAAEPAHPGLSGAGGGLVCVIVDEVDALHDAKGDDVLCRLFEWAALPRSRLVLIGIANAIDLTDRMIPALARRGCTPAVLTFPPYGAEDIVAILEERLARAGAHPDAAQPIVCRAALELCARKVCAASSDARRALDICRGALELALGQVEEKAEAAERARAAAASSGAAVGGTARAAAPLAVVSVPLMAKAVSSLFKSRVIELCASLPQHQQLFMCAAVLYFRAIDTAAHAAPSAPAAPSGFGAPKRPCSAAAGPTTVRRLYDAYARLCKEQSIKPISASEVVPVCQALASSGLLHVSTAGRSVGHASPAQSELEKHVSVAIAPAELALAVQEVRFFRQILNPAGAAMPGSAVGTLGR